MSPLGNAQSWWNPTFWNFSCGSPRCCYSFDPSVYQDSSHYSVIHARDLKYIWQSRCYYSHFIVTWKKDPNDWLHDLPQILQLVTGLWFQPRSESGNWFLSEITLCPHTSSTTGQNSLNSWFLSIKPSTENSENTQPPLSLITETQQMGALLAPSSQILSRVRQTASFSLSYPCYLHISFWYANQNELPMLAAIKFLSKFCNVYKSVCTP